MRLDQCPMLQISDWDWDVANVAVDWALERGLIDDSTAELSAFIGPLLPDGVRTRRMTPELIRASFNLNIDPSLVARPSAFALGYINEATHQLWNDKPAWGLYGFGHLTAHTAAMMVVDCAEFVRENKPLLDEGARYLAVELDMNPATARSILGSCFWSARNGVYFAYEAPAIRARAFVPALVKRARALGPFTLHVKEIGRFRYVIWHVSEEEPD